MSQFFVKQLCAVLTFFVISFCYSSAIAQPRILGKVIDATSKEPLIGARITFDPEYLSDSVRNLVKSKGAISRDDGSFELATPDTGSYILEVKYVNYVTAYVEFFSRIVSTDTLFAQLEREQTTDIVVQAKAEVRTVEDLCCRVEALNAELSNVAPFTADMQQVMSRYSSCTSYHINCTLDHSSTVRLRGMDNPYTLMLIEGVPLFSALTSQYGLQMIPALAAENVRILEGASSTLYGNNAMAGAMSFDLKHPKDERELFVQSNLASSSDHGLEGAYDLNAVYSQPGEKSHGAAVFSYNSHPMDQLQGAQFSTSPGLNRYSGYGRYELDVSDISSVEFIGLGGIDQRNVRMNTDTIADDQRVKTSLLHAIGKFELTPSDVTAITLTGAFSGAAQKVVDRIDGTEITSSTNGLVNLESYVTYGQAVMTHGAGDHYISTGGEVRRERITGSLGEPVVGAIFTSAIHDFSTASIFAEDQVALGDTWTMLVGGRFDHHSTAGNIVSPRGSVSWRPTDGLRMRVMAGQGIKGQALFNEDHRIMHGIYQYEYNDAFDYEKSLNLNYDMTYAYMIGESIGGEVNINTFFSLIDGKSIAQNDSLTRGKMFFVNDPNPTRLMGIEVQTRPSFGNNWSGSLAFSIVNLMRQLPNGEEERIALSPTINADASIMYQLPEENFAIETWASVIGKQRVPENPFGVETSPVFGLLNLRAQKKFGMFTVHAGMLNILDAEQTDTMPVAYNTTAGTVTTIGWGPMEGREFFAGVRVDL